MGLALQGYYSISNSTECKQTELFLLSSTNESICMKDGFLILVKSLLGGGKGCGEDQLETKNEVIKLRVLQDFNVGLSFYLLYSKISFC